MKNYIILLFLLIGCSSLQALAQEPELYPYPVGNKWGYLDKRGDPVILPMYDSAFHFSCRRARVLSNGNYSYITESGALIADFRFMYAKDFKEDRAVVLVADSSDGEVIWNYIDTSAQFISVQLRSLSFASDFGNSHAWVMSDDKLYVHIIDKNGKVVDPAETSYTYFDAPWNFYSEGYYRVLLKDYYSAYVDTMGVVRIKSKGYEGGNFHEGYAWFNNDQKFGFIDKKGQTVIPAQFDSTGDFSEGLAYVLSIKGDEFAPVRHYGFIDKQGNIVAPLQYDDAKPFHDGLAAVKSYTKYGFVDKTGKEVIPNIYEFAYSFHNGLALVKHNGAWEYINTKGDVVWRQK